MIYKNNPTYAMPINKSRFTIYLKSKIYRFALIIFFILFGTTKIDPVQSCDMKPEIKIIDESQRLSYFYSPLGKSVDSLRNSPFKNFILSTSERILPTINQISQCDSEFKLYFVYSPFISDKKASFQLFPSKATRYLDSPWVKYAIGSSPKPFIHVAFFWNERQFLLDQALMSGIDRPSLEIPLLPIGSQVYDSYVKEYKNNILPISNDPLVLVQKNLLTKFPPDINWLFLNSIFQASLINFGMFYEFLGQDVLIKTINLVENKYTNLVTTVFERSLISVNSAVYYKTILDLREVFDIQNYHIYN